MLAHETCLSFSVLSANAKVADECFRIAYHNCVSNWFINARVRLWKPMIEEIHMLETKGTNGMDFASADAKHMMPGTGDGIRPSMEPVFAADERSQEPWQGDKRSRVEESEMLMSFASYQHAMDIGGIDAVSLTLGLRHDGGQQNPHQMLHDFVG
ncbi:hypothetical protein BHE74_00014154 [Ensete ventricosum]|nr:hypothetical protein GW17_00015329 [Ensete ventricosum]RWW77665.1 hypothetical protein BHE74_00014154 [Ensete ventricosum]RZS00240.1 hypothetical protein BHM03_00029888 [Ensete ventricosum]